MSNHESLMKEIQQQFKPIFENSGQAIYIYLDDKNKICNKNFSDLLGYNSPEEWSKVKESFPAAFVDEQSQETLVSTFQNAMNELIGSTIEVTWKKKSGETIDTEVILVPINYKRHLFALHFINH